MSKTENGFLVLSEQEYQERYDRLITGYGMRDSIEYLGTGKVAVWHIRAEDTNADFGGSHHMETIGYFEGTIEEAIERAIYTPKFWAWGAGGDIRLIKIEKANIQMQRMKEAQDRYAEAKQALIKAEADLRKISVPYN